MQKNKEKRNNSKVFPILLAFVIVALLFGTKIRTAMQTKIEYNDFVQYVVEQRVEKVNIDYDSGKVEFSLKDSNISYYTNYPYSDDFEEALLTNGVDVEIHEPNLLFNVLKFLATPLLLLSLLLLFNNMGTSDFSIEPASNNKVKFSDIAGLNEVKKDLLTVSEMMKNPQYRERGARIPRGILLQGPPGNGKTLLARAFAGETGLNFIAVNACDFGSQFVGIGSNKIKKVFDVAKKNAPCIIFIDELDAVGAKRTHHSDSASKEMNTMLTALLNQMDGFNPIDNVMVLAATNRVDDLDEALIRPGRFDKQLVINYPDSSTRKEILKLYTKDIDLDKDVNLDKLVNKTFGYSSSKIECIVNDAIINSVRRESNNTVKAEDFDKAILEMTIKGHLKEDVDKDRKEKEIVAYHEAGHAIVAHFLSNKTVSSISVVPTTSGAGGFTITEEDEEDVLCPIIDYKNQITMLYGGRAAEVELRGSVELATAGASHDISEATKLASSYANIESGIDYSIYGELGTEIVMKKSEEILQNAWSQALSVVKSNWNYVKLIAQELIEKEIIEADRFLEIVNDKKETD